MDGFNFDSFKINMAEVNSAIKANLLAEQQQKNQQIFDQISKHNAKRDATIMAGAEANVAQKELLEQQLSTLGEQNKLLADNYSKLKEKLLWMTEMPRASLVLYAAALRNQQENLLKQNWNPWECYL